MRNIDWIDTIFQDYVMGWDGMGWGYDDIE
jgi:hypothetical protein